MWLGIELDQPVGKNDGSVSGIRYFDCKPSHGVFAPPSKVTRCVHVTHKRMNIRILVRLRETVESRTNESSQETRLPLLSSAAGEQGWRGGESTRLPPMWPRFNSHSVVGSRPCSKSFSSGYSSLPLK